MKITDFGDFVAKSRWLLYLIMCGHNSGDIVARLPIQVQNILTKKLPRQIHIISASSSLGSYIYPRILQVTFS
jgi:hypothetical protein